MLFLFVCHTKSNCISMCDDAVWWRGVKPWTEKLLINKYSIRIWFELFNLWTISNEWSKWVLCLNEGQINYFSVLATLIRLNTWLNQLHLIQLSLSLSVSQSLYSSRCPCVVVILFFSMNAFESSSSPSFWRQEELSPIAYSYNYWTFCGCH